MEHSTGRLTITADDLAAWATIALRTLQRKFRPPAESIDPAQRLAVAAQRELMNAHRLLKLNHLRAAGAIDGVALELHLKHVVREHGLDLRPYATIAQVQDRLRYAGLIDKRQRKLIGKLGAIRNQCVHARPDPLSRAAVEKLIHGVNT